MTSSAHEAHGVIIPGITEGSQGGNMICDNFGIVQFDKSGKIIDCNDNFLELIGTSRESAIGGSLLASIVNKEMWWTILSALSGKHGCYTGDYLAVSGNKNLKLKASFARIKSLSGEFIGGLGILEEIDRTDDGSSRKSE